MNEITSYEPLEAIKPFHASNARYRLLNGAIGSGKTTALCWEVIDLMMMYSGMTFLIARKYNEDLDGTTMAVFYEECEKYNVPLSDKLKGGRVFKLNGGTGIFSGLYTRQKTRITKLGSYNLSGFAGDETSEWSEEDFMMLQGRIRRSNTPWRGGIMAQNPPNIDHWTYKRFHEQKDDDYKYWKVSIYDNPKLPDDYVKNLEKEYSGNQSWFNRYLLGEWGFVSFGHPVYSGFNEKIHVRKLVYDPTRPVIRGWDFGFHHPCVSWCQLDAKGRYLIFDTIMGDRVYLEDFVPQIIEHSNRRFPGATFDDYCDFAGTHRSPNSPHSQIEILETFGIKPKFKFTDDIMKYVQEIQRKMSHLVDGMPCVMVDEDNRLAKEMFLGGYAFAKKSDGKIDLLPCKDGFYDNIADSIRYPIQYLYRRGGDKFKDFKMQHPSFGNTGSRYYDFVRNNYNA